MATDDDHRGHAFRVRRDVGQGLRFVRFLIVVALAFAIGYVVLIH